MLLKSHRCVELLIFQIGKIIVSMTLYYLCIDKNHCSDHQAKIYYFHNSVDSDLGERVVSWTFWVPLRLQTYARKTDLEIWSFQSFKGLLIAYLSIWYNFQLDTSSLRKTVLTDRPKSDPTRAKVVCLLGLRNPKMKLTNVFSDPRTLRLKC